MSHDSTVATTAPPAVATAARGAAASAVAASAAAASAAAASAAAASAAAASGAAASAAAARPAAASAVAPELATALPPRTLRLSGTAGCPRWRGRLHLVAAVVALPAGAALVARHPSPAVVLYVVGLIALYAVSAGYHLLPLGPLARRRLRQADHAMIYLFTAASVTAFCQLAVGGAEGQLVTGLIWLGAGVGMVLKVYGFDRVQAVGAGLYLGMGWLSAVTLPAALHHLDGSQVALLAGTAAFYTGGAGVLFTRRPDPIPHVFGYHEVWHGAVVAAGVCYFLVVWGLAGRPG